MDHLFIIELKMRLSNLERLVRRIVEPDQWMDIEDAEKYANVSASTLYRATKKGVLKHGRLKRKYLFKRSAIDRWLENG